MTRSVSGAVKPWPPTMACCCCRQAEALRLLYNEELARASKLAVELNKATAAVNKVGLAGGRGSNTARPRQCAAVVSAALLTALSGPSGLNRVELCCMPHSTIRRSEHCMLRNAGNSAGGSVGQEDGGQ